MVPPIMHDKNVWVGFYDMGWFIQMRKKRKKEREGREEDVHVNSMSRHVRFVRGTGIKRGKEARFKEHKRNRRKQI